MMLSLEEIIRLSFFVGVLVIMMCWESIKPARNHATRRLRWPSNIGMTLFNTACLFVLPFTAVTASLWANFNNFGLVYWLKMPLWPGIIASLILLDLAIYWQHRLFHQIPFFWRFHRLHHSDCEFDVTTALRFHPIEILLSICIKAVLIIFLGAPLLAVLAFEILLNGFAMFNHGNVSLGSITDKYLRYFVVTPNMHRVHHSTNPKEYNQNFGFNLSIWDKLFGSYHGDSSIKAAEMDIGLTAYRDKSESRFDKMLTQPFR